MRNRLTFISDTIKSLQRKYGSPVDYYQPLSQTTDLSSGSQTSSYNSLTIQKGLVLPFKVARGFTYDTAFLSAGNGDAKLFSFGAFHDTNDSTLIVTLAQMKGIKPKINDIVSWHSLRFDVKTVDVYPDIQVYVLTVVRTQSIKQFYFRTSHSICFEGTSA